MKHPTISRDFFGKWILEFAEVCFKPETEILIIKGIEKIVKTQQVEPILKIRQNLKFYGPLFIKESDKENLKIIGIYSTHAFGDEGLSLKMAHFNHSCKPNAG